MKIRFSKGDNYEVLHLRDYVICELNHYQDTLCAASCVGNAQSVQAVRAMLATGIGSVSTIGVGRDKSLSIDSVNGVTVATSKLPKYNQAHLVFRTKDASVVIGDRLEAVSSYLMSSEIDTPIIDAWLPTLVDALADGRYVTQLKGTIEAWKCSFNSKVVDSLVSKLIVCGRLKFGKATKRAPKLAAVGA